MRYFQENTSYDEKTYIENMSDDDRDIDIESDVSTKICQVQYFVNNTIDLFFYLHRMETIQTHDRKTEAQRMEHNIFHR